MEFRRGIFLKIALLFAITHALGIFIAYQILSKPTNVVLPQPVESFALADILVIVGAISVFVFIVSKFRRTGGWLFRIILIFLVIGGVQTIAEIWVGSVPAFFIGVLCALVFVLFSNVFTQNLMMILAFAGIGALLGLSLTPLIALLALAILSLYDVIAVYKTRHMVKMAENMISARAIFGFVIPEGGQPLVMPLSKVKPGRGFMLLGSGDVVLPLLLSISLVGESIVSAALVSIFSVLGLLLMYWIFTRQSERKPMAALPPIAMGAILGYIISLI